jgi:hypothetical protein
VDSWAGADRAVVGYCFGEEHGAEEEEEGLDPVGLQWGFEKKECEYLRPP